MLFRSVDRAADAFGGVDHVVNNAGVDQHVYTENLDPADFDRVMDVNVNSAFNVTKAALPHLRDSDDDPSAHGGGGKPSGGDTPTGGSDDDDDDNGNGSAQLARSGGGNDPTPAPPPEPPDDDDDNGEEQEHHDDRSVQCSFRAMRPEDAPTRYEVEKARDNAGEERPA